MGLWGLCFEIIVWYRHAGVLNDLILLLFPVWFQVYFQLYSPVFPISWYGHRYHVTLYIGQQHLITVYRADFGCALFLCWVSLGALFTISLIEFYFIMIFIMIVVTIIGIFMAINYFLNYTLDFLYLSSSGSANAQLPGCFRPWTFSLNIELMFPLDSFMSSLLGHSTGEFQALQLIILAAFGAVD